MLLPCTPNCVQLVVFPFRQIASTGRYDSSWLKDKLYGTSPIPTKLLSYVWSHWDHPIEVIVIVTCRTKPNGLLCYFHLYLSVYVHLSDIGIFIVYISPQASAFPLVQLFPHGTLRFPLHNNFCLWNITSLMYLSEQAVSYSIYPYYYLQGVRYQTKVICEHVVNLHLIVSQNGL